MLILALILTAGLAQAAQPAATPTSKPVAKKGVPAATGPHKSRLTMTPLTKPQPVVIAPKDKNRKPADPTSIVISYFPDSKLMLHFQSKDPNWELSPTAPLVVEIDAQDPLTVEPGVVTREEWNKAGGKPTVTVGNMARNQENHVFGKALYTVCKKKTKDCHKVKLPLDYTFRP